VLAQRGVAAESCPVSDALDRQVARFKQSTGVVDSLLSDPPVGAHPDLGAEPTREGTDAHLSVARQLGQRERLAQMSERPLAGLRRGGAGHCGQRAFDELRLTAFSPRRHHTETRCRVRDLAAVIVADHVQTEVDAGRDAGGGEHASVFDEQHSRVDAYTREQEFEVLGAAPVRRCETPVQQAGGGEHVGARADRHHSGRLWDRAKGASERLVEYTFLVELSTWLLGRDHHSVGGGQCPSIMIDHDPVVAGSADCAAGQRACRHVVKRNAICVAGGAEDAGGDAEVERDHAVKRQNTNAMHGSNYRVHRPAGHLYSSRRPAYSAERHRRSTHARHRKPASPGQRARNDHLELG